MSTDKLVDKMVEIEGLIRHAKRYDETLIRATRRRLLDVQQQLDHIPVNDAILDGRLAFKYQSLIHERARLERMLQGQSASA